MISDTPKGSLIILDSPLPLALLGEPSEGDRSEIDGSSGD